jgi:hypothetical protein
MLASILLWIREASLVLRPEEARGLHREMLIMGEVGKVYTGVSK